MVPETVAALFAVAKLGAVFLPIFSGYGADAVAIRLDDADAVALVTADGFTRRGRVVPMKETADTAVAQVASVHTVVVVPRLGRTDVPMQPGRDLTLDELTALGNRSLRRARGRQRSSRSSSRTRAERPDVRRARCTSTAVSSSRSPKRSRSRWTCDRGERLFWLTDIGWIMGPWEIVGTLANGGTLVLYDGAPDHPGPDRLWSIVARHRVAILGVSPTLGARADGPR